MYLNIYYCCTLLSIFLKGRSVTAHIGMHVNNKNGKDPFIIRILLSFACALNLKDSSEMEAKEVEPNSGVTEQGSCNAG